MGAINKIQPWDRPKSRRTPSIPESEFWDTLLEDIFGPREGGAVILVDAEDARKGVGKTSCAVGLARFAAAAFGYELKEDDFVLAGEKYLQRLQDHPGTEQPSVVVWDEAVGAGSGDARRSMAEQNRVMGQAWQMMRTKRIVSISTLPDWGDLDIRLRKLADYRVWCQRQPIGVFKAYQIETQFRDGTLRVKGLGAEDGAGRVEFPNMDAADDPFYEYISNRKDQLINDGSSFDADEVLFGDDDEDSDEPSPDDIRREKDIQIALLQVKPWDDDAGKTQLAVADLIGRSQGWVSKRVREWRDGQHRDLVEPPGGD